MRSSEPMPEGCRGILFDTKTSRTRRRSLVWFGLISRQSTVPTMQWCLETKGMSICGCCRLTKAGPFVQPLLRCTRGSLRSTGKMIRAQVAGHVSVLSFHHRRSSPTSVCSSADITIHSGCCYSSPRTSAYNPPPTPRLATPQQGTSPNRPILHQQQPPPPLLFFSPPPTCSA